MNAHNETLLEIANKTNASRTEFDEVQMMTRLISNEFAEAFKYCGMTVVDMYVFAMN